MHITQFTERKIIKIMRKRIGNDFQFYWIIKENNIVINPDAVIDFKIIIRHRRTGYEIVAEFDVVNSSPKIKCENLLNLGIYDLIATWKIVDATFTDGYRDCTADIQAFEIVSSSSSECETDLTVTSEIAIGFEGADAFEVWLKNGNEGKTYEDYIAFLQKPATLAAAAADLAKEAANSSATLANDKAVLAQSAATLANTKAGLANDAAILATDKAGLADSKATLANDKAALAQSAATLANTKAAEVTAAVLSAGQLGSIKPTDSAPTPGRNGNYTFSIGGAKPAWLTAEAGVTTVKAGDGVAVVFTAPSSYTYTHVNMDSAFLQKTMQTLTTEEQLQVQINTGVDKIIKFNDLINSIFTIQGYINLSDGSKTKIIGWFRTDYIKLSDIELIDYCLVGATTVASIAFYDINRDYISGIAATVLRGKLTTYSSVPSGAVYVILTKINEANNGQYLFIKYVNSIEQVNYNYAPLCTKLGYIGLTGIFKVDLSGNWLSSDFLEIDSLSIYTDVLGYTTVNTLSFYTDKFVFISGIHGTANGAIFIATTNVPVGAKYFKASIISPTYGANNYKTVISATINLYNKILNKTVNTPIKLIPFRSRKRLNLTGKKILLYGDSISSNDYTWYKTSMESLTGAIVTNGGFSGYTTAQLAQNAQLQRIFDNNPDLIICLIGGNDSGVVGSVGTFGEIAGEQIVAETDISLDYSGTFLIQAVSHIIRKIKAQYYDIRTRANLTGTETEAEKTAKIDAVLKPHLVFCTTLPQKRIAETDVFSMPENWNRRRDAVVECCNKYQVDCVDLCNITGIDWTKEFYYVGPTDKINNKGIYTMDGVHPNKYGYQIISEIICAEIGIEGI